MHLCTTVHTHGDKDHARGAKHFFPTRFFLFLGLFACFLPPNLSWDLEKNVSTRYCNKTHTRGYPLEPNPISRVFPVLTRLGFEFGFSPISKYGYHTGIYVPTLNPYPNSSRMQKITLCWYVILFCLIIVVL